MALCISVIISTHNPDIVLLNRTLDALNAQTLHAKHWELIVVDNASAKPVYIGGTSWNCANFRVVREERLGLTYGRVAGIRNSESSLLVFVDDDNVLAPDYLESANNIFGSAENLGVAGGIIEPEWCDAEPESWVSEFIGDFARRNFGDSALIASKVSHGNSIPEYFPYGAGMVARRAALTNWLAQADHSAITGRRGPELTSGEDLDIVLEALHSNWSVGYFPDLKLTHLIPGHRLRVAYLARLYHDSAKSWVHLAQKHGFWPITPVEPWSLPLRKIHEYLRNRAWAGPARYVRWQRACGTLDGRAELHRSLKVGSGVVNR
jgi:glycosyltransferase involved in cell wall biosynthesis